MNDEGTEICIKKIDKHCPLIVMVVSVITIFCGKQ